MGVLDGVREVKKMPEQAFEVLYDEISKEIPAYMDTGERIAYIIGYFKGIYPDTVFTARQVSQILALGFEEKE